MKELTFDVAVAYCSYEEAGDRRRVIQAYVRTPGLLRISCEMVTLVEELNGSELQ